MFAMESVKTTADMVEASEFPQLAQRYSVMGVPKTIANGRSAAEAMFSTQTTPERSFRPGEAQ